MRSVGLEFRYLLFEGLGAWLRRRRDFGVMLTDLSRRFEAQIEIHYLPRPLSPPGLYLAASFVTSVARGLSPHPGPLLIQARGPEAAWVATEVRRRLKAVRVLYDARSDYAAEARLEGSQMARVHQRRRWDQRAKRLEFLERHACEEADHVLVVSGPLRDRVCTLGNIRPDDVTVIPCCVNPDRFRFSSTARQRLRKQLDLDGRFVLVYAGSLSAWQIPDRIAALVTALTKQFPETHLLLLTPDRENAHRFFGKLIEEGHCTLRSCAFDSVGEHLAAADAALLLRQTDPVNRVACPVKFAEYQASGLPVIASSGIGDVSDYILHTGFGLLTDLEDSVNDQAARLAAAIRERRWIEAREDISRQAIRIYSRESYRETYGEILRRLGIAPHPTPAHAPAQTVSFGGVRASA